MLSFKDYRKLNESFGPIALGLGQVPTVGVIGGQGISLEEGKKKGCSKMEVDDDEKDKEDKEEEKEGGVKVVKDKVPDDKDEPEEDEPEEEEGDKKPTFFQKKKSKKKMQSEGLFGKKLGKGPPPEDLGDEKGPEGEIGEPGDEEGDEDLGDEDLGDEEGDEDLGDKDLGDEEGDEDLGDEDLGKKTLIKKKKPPMGDMGGEGPAMFMKKRSRKGMSKEQAEWWDSVEGQLSADPDPRFYDGFTEIKSVEQAVREGEPKAGELGFAPQGRVGSWF